MTYVIPFRGMVGQCWKVFYSEYNRLNDVLGRPPFEFVSPKHSIIHEYIPQYGDEIIVNFWDTEHKYTVLVVEVEPIPDEDDQCNIFVHPQGNAFEEPVKSAISIWKEIKKALEKGGKRRIPRTNRRKKKRNPQPSTITALEELRQIYFETQKKKQKIIPRTNAANIVGIAKNTWRTHDLELWHHWEDDKYRIQKMQ